MSEIIKISKKIINLSKTAVIVNFRFFDIALSNLKYVPESNSLETDGKYIYYNPIYVIQNFKGNKKSINHALLHMLLHCVFSHMFIFQRKNKRYWDLACDIAVENIILQLKNKAFKIDNEFEKEEIINKIRQKNKYMVANQIYNYFSNEKQKENTIKKYENIFKVDNHEKWYISPEEDNSKTDNQTNNSENELKKLKDIWSSLGEKIITDLETFAKDIGNEQGDLIYNLKAIKKEKYNYQDFLKKFSVLGENMKINDDEFDYIFYTYGLSLYKNMPLIEPLEYKEEKKIKEFVIAIDTSGSVSGELVQTFIKKTYNILQQQENFFKKVNIHIIQCDTVIQEDKKITSNKDFEVYIKTMKLKGFGGTDFRPVFKYVDSLVKKKEFQNLKGLIYFTDGYGYFPNRKPDYQTAFVFIKEDYDEVDVPVWAIKYILDKSEFEEERHEY